MSVPRVAALLGKTVEAAGLDDWRRLVDAGTPESFDLDFKRQYSVVDPDFARKFATDVAAFANAMGGVIVVGVAERGGAAGELVGVVFDELLEQRMSQAVANLVFPKPNWRIQRVQQPTDSTTGLLLCVVPRSRLSPHAVFKDDALRYPVRRNARAEFLAEHEVADRYRQRFVRGAESESRVVSVRREGAAGWSGWDVANDSPLIAHIEAVLVPIEGGEFCLTRELLERQHQQLLRLPSGNSFSRSEVATGFRRIRVRDASASRSTRGDVLYGELHTDGAGYTAAAIGVFKQDDRSFVTPSNLLCVAAESLERLSAGAALGGCVGDGLLSMRLHFPGGPAVPRLGLEPGLRWECLPSGTGPFLSEQTVPLVRSARDSMLVLRSVLTDWHQGFGVPESDLIEPDGTIDSERWTVVAEEAPETTIRRRGSFPPEVIRR